MEASVPPSQLHYKCSENTSAEIINTGCGPEALITFNSSSACHCSSCAEPRGKPTRKGAWAGGTTSKHTSSPDINSSQNRTAALMPRPLLWATGIASCDPHSHPIRMAFAGCLILQIRRQRLTELSPKNDIGEPKFNSQFSLLPSEPKLFIFV